MTQTPTNPGARVPGQMPGRPPTQRPGAPATGGAIAIDPMKVVRQYWNWLVASVIGGVVIGIGLYFGLRIVWPRFDSMVTFEVFPQPKDPFAPDTSVVGEGGEQEMEAYMQTQVFVMRSAKILKRVVEDNSVQETNWARPFRTSTGFDLAEAHDELEDILSVRRIPDTQIIMLSVRTRVPRDAKIIAEAVGETFLSDVRTREVRRLINLKDELENRLGELRASVASVDAEKRNLLAQNTVTSINETNSVYLNEARNLQQQLVQISSDRVQRAEQLRVHEAMLDEPGGAVFPEQIRQNVEQGPLVANLDAQLAMLKSRLRSLEENGGASGVRARQLRRDVDGLERERESMIEARLPQEFAAFIETLRDDVRNLEANETEILDNLQTARQNLNSTTLILQQHEDLLAERKRLLDQIADIEERIGSLDIYINRPIRVRMLDDARMPDRLAFPQPIPVVGLAIFFVPALAGGLIVLRELREQRIRGPQDVALIHRTPVLGVIPDKSMDPANPQTVDTIMRDAPGGVLAESYRQVRTALLNESKSHGHVSVLVFAGMPGSGATSFVSNTALALAETDARVLVIDANVRRPRVGGILGSGDGPGLSDVLTGRSTLNQAVQSTQDPFLNVLSAGARDPKIYERFPSGDMAGLLVEASGNFDVVLVDAPPAVVSSDALAIAQHCDATILVAKAYSEKRGLVARLRNQFGNIRAQFLGVVVNGVKPSAGGYFKRNFRVTHEYGREAIEVPAPTVPGPDPSTNGSLDHE